MGLVKVLKSGSSMWNSSLPHFPLYSRYLSPSSSSEQESAPPDAESWSLPELISNPFLGLMASRPQRGLAGTNRCGPTSLLHGRDSGSCFSMSTLSCFVFPVTTWRRGSATRPPASPSGWRTSWFAPATRSAPSTSRQTWVLPPMAKGTYRSLPTICLSSINWGNCSLFIQ